MLEIGRSRIVREVTDKLVAGGSFERKPKQVDPCRVGPPKIDTPKGLIVPFSPTSYLEHRKIGVYGVKDHRSRSLGK